MTSLFNIVAAMAYMHAHIAHAMCMLCVHARSTLTPCGISAATLATPHLRHTAKVAARYSPQKIKIHFTIWQLGKNNFDRLGACCRPHAAGADNPKELTQPLPVRGVYDATHKKCPTTKNALLEKHSHSI
jgi:hypothetical protein